LAIALVQSTGAQTVSPVTSAVGLSASFSSNVGTGNLIVVGVTIGGAGTSATVTDNLGNTYTQAVPFSIVSSSTVAIFYAKNITGGACTVTAKPSSTQDVTLGICEYSGADTSAPLDTTASSGGTSTSPSSGSATPANANSLIVGALTTGGSAATITNGSGFTSRYQAAGTPQTLDVEDKFASSSVAATWTLAASQSWAAVAAIFKPSATSTTPSAGDSGNGSETVSIIAVVVIRDPGAGVDGGFGFGLGTLDSGLGSENQSAAQAVRLADSGIGGEGFGLASAVQLLDTATATPEAALASIWAQPVNAYDSGVGAESFAFATALPLVFVDSGLGTECIAVAAVIATLEAGAGADSASVVIGGTPVAILDTGRGSEAFTGTSALVALDSGLGSQGQFRIAFGMVEPAAGSDLSGSNIGTGATDSGTGADSAINYFSVLKLFDAGLGSESAGLGVGAVDGGTGGESASLITSVRAIDSGIGSEGISSGTATLIVLDTGLGSEGSFAIASGVTDSASGSESVPSIRLGGIADSGVGSESLSSASTLAYLDTGLGSESSTIGIFLRILDTGVGAEGLPLLSLGGIGDSGVGSEFLTSTATLTALDTGLGSEGPLGLAFSFGDIGAGSESLANLGQTFLSLLDSGRGSESASLSAALGTRDVASGTDALAAIVLALPDAATGTEGLPFIILGAIRDSGTGADQGRVSANLILLETASGTDSLPGPNLNLLDLAIGSEFLLPLVSLILRDSAIGTEALSSILPGGFADSGTGGENLGINLSLQDSATGIEGPSALSLGVLDPASALESIAPGGLNLAVRDVGVGTETTTITAILSLSDLGLSSSSTLAGPPPVFIPWWGVDYTDYLTE
jgi:hypothetical protein